MRILKPDGKEFQDGGFIWVAYVGKIYLYREIVQNLISLHFVFKILNFSLLLVMWWF